MVNVRQGTNAFCDVSDVRELVCEPGELIPDENLDDVRKAILSICVEMTEAWTAAGLGKVEGGALHDAHRINAMGAAGLYGGNVDWATYYADALKLWAPKPAKKTAKATKATEAAAE